MKDRCLFATCMFILSAISTPLLAQQESIYIAVEPCRIVNTRLSSMGAIQANTSRNFRVFGSAADLAVQGGTFDCPNPKAGEGISPLAVAAYIVAVPAESSTRDGILAAYPSDQPAPPPGAGATVNFAKDQIIGNTTITTLCDSNNGPCPDDGTLAVLARDTDQNVVVDVQGYFFPANAIPGYQLVQNGFAIANAAVVVGTVQCPAGKRVLGGGGTVIDPTWFMDSSVPTPSATGWQVRYRSSNGGTFSAAGSVWAICALVD